MAVQVTYQYRKRLRLPIAAAGIAVPAMGQDGDEARIATARAGLTAITHTGLPSAILAPDNSAANILKR